MAQTIALQRGTTTVQCNGTSSATLFTQSGGTATRVILNQLGFYFASTPAANTVFAGVFHESSGGQSFLLGLIRDPDRRRSYQFVPGAFTQGGFGGTATQTGTSTAAVLSNAPCIGATGSTGIGSSDVNGGVIVEYSTAAGYKYSMMPSNFYIGPSDVISMKIFGDTSGGPVTTYISYSFTTITES